MFLKQYYLGCLSHASYMIADERTKTAVVVDPQRDIDQYMADAKTNGFQIRYVYLTHFHADFLAGHIELRDRAGAQIVLGRHAKAEFPAVYANDGDEIDFGDVRIEVLETPGHTPEGITLLVYDLKKSAKIPHAALTGDTLFIGDVGRPDLLASIGVTADELAEMLFDSIHNKIMKLPDETLVYPAHGAGSMCGKNLSKETVSTIGEQKKFNYALQPMGRNEFKALVTKEQPEAPAYFVHDAILNRKDRSSLSESIEKAKSKLSVSEVQKLQSSGVQILDIREAIDFAGGHWAGAINVPLQGKYATWCGTVLSHDTPIVVIGEDDQIEEATMRLGRIGFDNVVGSLEGGMASLEQHPDLIAKTERITAVALSQQIASKEAPLVLDVRTEREFQNGHIAGSMNIPLNRLQQEWQSIPTDRPIVVHCEGGYRSTIAVSLLQQNGMVQLQDMVGGIKAWLASQLPTTQLQPSCCGGCS